MPSVSGWEASGREVSMKSGLEGRNNMIGSDKGISASHGVSMKSGLEGRNNGCLEPTQ